MSEIIPAILATSVSDLNLKLNEVPENYKFVHIDVLEQDFWSETKISFEAHLMVPKPSVVVERWIKRGAKRIIAHSLGDWICKVGDVEIGLGVELHIPLEEIFPLVHKVDFLHLMSIAEIGEQGHPLDEKIFDRINKVKEKFPELPLSVDGGVNATNFQQLSNLGVNRLIVGSGFKTLYANQ